ncbi:MAG: RNA polymerase sigma factor [Bacteroidia bacterium]|nr:RNA polymerase sigma factor [Bacteroidia bacterium]
MIIEEYNKSVDLFSDSVYRFILKNIQDSDKAKDIVQDTYEKLWLNFESVSFIKVKSYIFTTAYHTMIDIIRKEKKQRPIEEINFQDYYHNDQFSDIKDVLNIAVKKLPDDQRAVVLLRDYEGYSYNEIAEITGLTETQVKVYIYRARIFLKNCLLKIYV